MFFAMMLRGHSKEHQRQDKEHKGLNDTDKDFKAKEDDN
jgi:hypothetical protein